MHNGPFGKRRNSIAVFKGLYLQNYCTKSKNYFIINFVRSFQIHKGPTSDIGTLIKLRGSCISTRNNQIKISFQNHFKLVPPQLFVIVKKYRFVFVFLNYGVGWTIEYVPASIL
jgi:hypothetical protein